MAFTAAAQIMKNYPFAFGSIFSCAKTSFSDYLVQTQFEKKEHIDWRRNATFASFGLFYLGGVQYGLYVPVFSRLFPNAASYAAKPLSAKLKDVTGTRNMLAQVGIDQFVHHPLMYFPVFYVLKEVVNGGSPSAGLEKYSRNYQEDLVALWKLWVPSTIINFTFMPMHLRIPWVATTSLLWTCILSVMRGGEEVEMSADKAMEAVGNQGKAALAKLHELLDLGVSAKPAYSYNKDKAHVLLTASGRDRIGLVQEVCAQITANDGNVLDVKGYKVGREFVTIMLVEVAPSACERLKQHLNGTEGLQVSVQSTQPWLSETDSPRCKDGISYTGHLRATGSDQPGILLKVTSLLAELELDVVSVQCNQRYQYGGPGHSTEQLFQIEGAVRAFTPVDREHLEARLIEFEKQSGIVCGIQETAPDPSFSAFGSPGQLSRHNTKRG